MDVHEPCGLQGEGAGEAGGRTHHPDDGHRRWNANEEGVEVELGEEETESGRFHSRLDGNG